MLRLRFFIISMILLGFFVLLSGTSPQALGLPRPGDPDLEFADNGRLLYNFWDDGRGEHFPTALELTPEGHYLLGGLVHHPDVMNGNHRIGLFAFRKDANPVATFGADGELIVQDIVRLNENMILGAMRVLDGGKIMIAGSINDGAASRLLVLRLNPDGTADPTFRDANHRAGVVLDLQQSADEIFNTVAIDAQNRVVAGGMMTLNGNTVILIARFNPDGSLDRTFFGNGFRSFQLEGSRRQFVSGLVVDDLNRIIVAGQVQGNNRSDQLFLMRILPDGSFDPAFQGNGLGFLESPQVANVFPQALRTDSRGNYVVGGSLNGGESLFFLKIAKDGNVISTFRDDNHPGGGVVIEIPGAAREKIMKFVMDAGDRILASGYVEIAGSRRTLLLRLLANGQLDPNFGNGGLVVTDLVKLTHDEFTDIALDAEGNILALGYAQEQAARNLALLRFKADLGQPLPPEEGGAAAQGDAGQPAQDQAAAGGPAAGPVAGGGQQGQAGGNVPPLQPAPGAGGGGGCSFIERR